MKVTVTDFKAKCTDYIRRLRNIGRPIEVTRRGAVVAVVSLPEKSEHKNPAFGALKGSITYIADDFDEPLGDDEWEAGGDDVSA